MTEYSLKEVAIMKKAFIESDFGKFAAQKITEMHGSLHEKAENAASASEKATYVDQAAGITRIIAFFTADVALLDQGYFDEKEHPKPMP